MAKFLALTPKQGSRPLVEGATRDDVKTGSLLIPFTFRFSSIMKIHGNMAYTIALPLLSKVRFTADVMPERELVRYSQQGSCGGKLTYKLTALATLLPPTRDWQSWLHSSRSCLKKPHQTLSFRPATPPAEKSVRMPAADTNADALHCEW